MKPIKPHVGGIVVGPHFFGREKDIARLREMLADGKSILFSEPRNTGKSSLIKEFIRRDEGKVNVIYVDIMKCEDFIDFSNAVLRGLTFFQTAPTKGRNMLRSFWNTLAGMIQEVKAFGFGIKTGKIRADPRQVLEKLSPLIKKSTKKNCIFVFDEFADFILNMKENKADTEYFLKWLHEIMKEKKMQAVLTGSVNITSTIESLHLSHLLSETNSFHLTPLNLEETGEFFQRLLLYKEITVKDAALDYALTKLPEGSYYYVQFFADSLSILVAPGKTMAEVEEVESLYEKIIQSKSPSLVHFHSRLVDEKYLPKEHSTICLSLLAHLSDSPMSEEDIYPYFSDSVDRRTLLTLLKRLLDEGYIVIDQGRYRFVSIMLADWWKYKYFHER